MGKILASLAAVGALTAAAPASAATIWFDDNDDAASAGSGDYYFSNGGVTVRVSAWSINPNEVIRAATLGIWDNHGLGVQHSSDGRLSSDGNHTTDNLGWKDFLVFQFDKTVELESGWFYSDWSGIDDTDATIGYGNFVSPLNTPLALAGLNQSALNIFTQFDSNESTGDEPGAPDLNSRNINPGNAVGNVWLIGASFNDDTPDDGFKFKKLSYNVAPPPVPEPSTWALLILGFGAVGAAMRMAGRRRGELALS